MKTLPEGFIDMLAGLGLGDAVEALAGAAPEVSVRVNRSKPVEVDAAVVAEQVPWCPAGCYLKERPVFALDPCWHQGRYYVQEAGSMFVNHVVRSLSGNWSGPIAVLDACAAPGGKTTAVIDAVPQGSLVVANEYVPARAAVLKENVVKWGYPAAVVTRGDTARLARLGETFDLIVADVPCSGEGMMRKDDDAVAQWSPGLIRECAALQWEIVCNLWETLRPGGLMIYSTCTFNREEDELNVMRILDELGGESVAIPVEADWGITGAIESPGVHAYRFIPGRTRGEGLFLSVIRKPADGSGSDDGYSERSSEVFSDRKQSRNKQKRDSKATQSAKVPDTLRGWLTGSADYEFYVSDDRVNAFPRAWMPVLQRLRSVTDVIHDGIHVASLKGRDYVPAHGLIMSSAFNKDAFPIVDIDKDTALRYLRGDSPSLPTDIPRGIVTLTYAHHPIGLVKNLGSRSNSLYPKEWRLKI